MKRRMFVLILATVAFPAAAEDLVQIYRDALVGDPTLAAARATYNATQEVLPQARSGLLPVLSVLGNANKQDFRENLHSDPSTTFTQRFPQYFYTLSASQPLFRMQNWISFDQAKQQIGQSEYVLASAQQDLIVRVAQAYFDVLLAQFTIELTESQKAAVSENLAQAQRNFEVGVATITDTNDAQAKYDQVAAQEISVQNDLDNKIAALRAIIGRTPNQLKRVERSFEPEVPAPNAIEPWIDKALNENYQVRIAQGGLVNSRVRQAIANQDAARQNLEQARRAAQLLAQTSFTGVTSGVAQVKALTQAVKSAQVSYDSTKLGLEVGVRTNLDVLNQQQQVYQTRFNLAQSYYAYIINALKLKQAAGTLSDQDVEKINRDLGG